MPTADWLRGPLAAALEANVRDGQLYGEGWFDRAAAERLRREHASRVHDRSAVLWPLLTLGLWFDRFHAGRAA